jgi:NAD(P)-dependent dehydrogenase (short-subunit alcohol dehydrogenase family)
MDGKIVVITGASDGVGAAAAVALHTRGATVVPVGRSPEKTARVAALVGADPLVVDFSRLDAVRQLADDLRRRYPRIDVLADNAGGTWPNRQVTEDGHELTFQVNHLAPFLLTNLLRDQLAAASGRVIVTSSGAYARGRVHLDDLESTRRYRGFRVYATTKLENILFARELARRWRGLGVTAASFHPGLVATQFGRDGTLSRLAYRAGRVFMKTPEQGASTLVWLATAAPSDWRNGGYHAERAVAEVRRQAADAELASTLWERSAQMVGIDP